LYYTHPHGHFIGTSLKNNRFSDLYNMIHIPLKVLTTIQLSISTHSRNGTLKKKDHSLIHDLVHSLIECGKPGLYVL